MMVEVRLTVFFCTMRSSARLVYSCACVLAMALDSEVDREMAKSPKASTCHLVKPAPPLTLALNPKLFERSFWITFAISVLISFLSVLTVSVRLSTSFSVVSSVVFAVLTRLRVLFSLYSWP